VIFDDETTIDRRHDRVTLRAWRSAVLVLLIVVLSFLGYSHYRLRARMNEVQAETASLRRDYEAMRRYVNDSMKQRQELDDLSKEIKVLRDAAKRKFGRH